MRALLIYPKTLPHIYTLKKAMLRLGNKSLYPPLGLLTAASMLPDEWEFKLVDCNLRPVSEEMWAWADMVLLSAMMPQREDLHAQIREAKKRGKAVVVGGPYATALPEEAGNSGADFLVLNEGEITIPLFLQALAMGETSGVFSNETKPDVQTTPSPRYDLLDFNDYAGMALQYSRGCPFMCEFCDIITLYGRVPRVKTPEQMLEELTQVYDMGWRGLITLIDDNFIGNKRHAKVFLTQLKIWLEEKRNPFVFVTEASIDLAGDLELLNLMVDCNFKAVFVGVETPDKESLKIIKKTQNLRSSLTESVDVINQAGIAVIAGMIIGFDGEEKGAGERIVNFVETAAITIPNFGILQALPTTALWDRLEKAGRIVTQDVYTSSSKVMNFIPSRPKNDIVNEYIDASWQLFEPRSYLKRVYNHVMRVKIEKNSKSNRPAVREWLYRLRMIGVKPLVLVLSLLWQHGIVMPSRWDFWGHILRLLKNKPQAVFPYLANCAMYDDLDYFRQSVKERMTKELV